MSFEFLAWFVNMSFRNVLLNTNSDYNLQLLGNREIYFVALCPSPGPNHFSPNWASSPVDNPRKFQDDLSRHLGGDALHIDRQMDREIDRQADRHTLYEL